MPTVYEEIAAAKELLDRGLITQEEFDAKKAQLLARSEQREATQEAAAEAAASPKSKIAAGLLAIFLGALGIHKFYLGYTSAGVIMLLVTLLGSLVLIGPLVMNVIALIEGIIYLTKSDEQFNLTYVAGERAWF